MKKISVFLCAVICSSLIVSCGSSDEKEGDGSGHMYNAALCGNPQSLDPQFASDEASGTVISNLYSGLMKRDNSGNIVNCNAESYQVSSDGITYTFKLRDDNFWFFDMNENDKVDDDEYFPVTANDYVFAFKRILTPEMQSPYANDFSCIKGGEAVISGNKSTDSIGVTAKNDYSLEIQLEYPCAEFLGLLATNAAVPCNEDFFLSTKGRYGLDDKSVMSNGAFFIRQWFYDPYGVNNILYMKRNEANNNETQKIYPSFLSFSIEKNESDIRQLYKDGTIECFTTLNKGSYSKKKNNIAGSRAITLGLLFNSEDKVYSNINIRKAIAYSIDRAELQNKIDDDVQAAYGVIPPAVTLLGRSYRTLSSDRIFDNYNIKEATSLFEKAKKELNAESFETVKILVSTETIDSAYLHILSQCWQDTFGYYIGVEEVSNEEFYQRIDSGDYKIALYPLKGKTDSGFSFIEQISEQGSNVAKTLLSDLKKSDSAASLVEKYSAAEAEIIDECSFIPLFYKNCYLISKESNSDIIYDPFSGAVDYGIAKNYD